jgi:hypothetical protein
MYSRKAVYTTGRWRLSVHNTASTSDIQYTHCTRYPTEVPAALTTHMNNTTSHPCSGIAHGSFSLTRRALDTASISRSYNFVNVRAGVRTPHDLKEQAIRREWI